MRDAWLLPMSRHSFGFYSDCLCHMWSISRSPRCPCLDALKKVLFHSLLRQCLIWRQITFRALFWQHLSFVLNWRCSCCQLVTPAKSKLNIDSSIHKFKTFLFEIVQLALVQLLPSRFWFYFLGPVHSLSGDHFEPKNLSQIRCRGALFPHLHDLGNLAPASSW